MTDKPTVKVIPESFKGDLNSEIVGIFVGVRQSRDHKGLLILDFDTVQGPLPLYCYGRTKGNAITLRSNRLSELDFTGGDLDKEFILMPGVNTKSDGSKGKPCVKAIERKTNTKKGPSKAKKETGKK